MLPRPFALVAQTQGTLHLRMPIDAICAVEEGIAHRQKFESGKIIDLLLSNAVHLANVQQPKIRIAAIYSWVVC